LGRQIHRKKCFSASLSLPACHNNKPKPSFVVILLEVLAGVKERESSLFNFPYLQPSLKDITIIMISFPQFL